MFRSEALVGWVAVHKETDANGQPIPGLYCLTPETSVTRSNAVLILSMGSAGGTPTGSVEWDGYCSTDPAVFQVATFDAAGAPHDEQFTAMVP